MAARAAKRQRRLTVLSSDSEAEAQAEYEKTDAHRAPKSVSAVETQENSEKQCSDSPFLSNTKPLPLLSSRPATISLSQAPDQAPSSLGVSSSPEKKKYRKLQSSNTTTCMSLKSFFPPTDASQQCSSQKFEANPSSEPVVERVDDIDDIIDDDYDSYDELFTQHFMNRNDTIRDDTKAISNSGVQALQPSLRSNAHSPQKSPSFTKRFIMPSASHSNSRSRTSLISNSNKNDDKLPWAQRYPPLNLDELAVHKKKVSDVQNWLNLAFTDSQSRLLVLRGPAGSGKTTTISLLSNILNFNIVEWKNPTGSEFAMKGYTSVAAQFEEFLGRGNKFRGLDLDEDRADSNVSAPHQRVILIEEFPAVLQRGSASLDAFRTSLKRYLASPAASKGLARDGLGNSPIIIIVSETPLKSGSSFLDNLTVHRLLGPELSNHANTTIIDFNSIAPTFMYKALKLVLDKDARHSTRTNIPGQAMLESISETGDIRSAISSLEFLCLKVQGFGTKGRNTTTKGKRSPRNSVPLTSLEKEALGMITQREASLGIFHAVGKIMYNKREDAGLATEALKLPPPPDHMRHHDRPKVSQVSVNDLVDETGTDTQTFISALHENYVPSCDGPSFIDCLDGCIEALSDSDMLCVDRKGSRAGSSISMNRANAGVDMLRQDEISYQVASRGLLFSLPYPVKRRITSADRKGNANYAYKMFFPTALRLSNEIEEIEDLIEVWTKRLLHRFNFPHSRPSLDCGRDFEQADVDGMQTIIMTMTSRSDLLLYQLPYMAEFPCNEIELRELRKITGLIGNEAQVNTMKVNGSSPTNQGALRSQGLRHAKYENKSNAFKPGQPLTDEEEKLILSDDDIVDD